MFGSRDPRTLHNGSGSPGPADGLLPGSDIHWQLLFLAAYANLGCNWSLDWYALSRAELPGDSSCSPCPLWQTSQLSYLPPGNMCSLLPYLTPEKQEAQPNSRLFNTSVVGWVALAPSPVLFPTCTAVLGCWHWTCGPACHTSSSKVGR